MVLTQLTAPGWPRTFFTKEMIMILKVITNIFLTINIALFVNFPKAAIVHMDFHNKESQPERQNNFFYTE